MGHVRIMTLAEVCVGVGVRNEQEKRSSCASHLLLISGGDGFDDSMINSSENLAVSSPTISNKEDNASHLLIWQL